MKPVTIRRLHALHRWLGVIVSLNLSLLCLTGLVLIFRHEVDALLGDLPPSEAATGAPLPFAALLEHAQGQDRERVPSFVGWDEEEHPGQALVVLRRPGGTPQENRVLTLDRSRGTPIGAEDHNSTFTGIILDLHASLLLGPLGSLLLGVIGLAFVVLLVLGFLLYGPFMKKLAFGAIRRGRPGFVAADLHKAMGAATFAWTLVVGLTGALLAFGGPLIQLFLLGELKDLRTPPSNTALPPPALSIDAALTAAQREMPTLAPGGVALPGSDIAGEDHYAILMRGHGGLEEKLFSIAFVHKESAAVTPVELPWYLKAVVLSQPLHFGDYGGTPLRILWASFTLITLAITASGVWIFVVRRKRRSESIEEAAA